MKKLLFPIALCSLLLTAADVPKRTNNGPWRLQYHFTPPHNWTNDPNGLVFYKGEYHLFYQYNPFGDKWGHMSWGHAVSPDLLHWKDLPVALPEENGIMIFSGSAVVDQQNSSGLCKSNGSDRSCLIAIYTGHTPERQTQNIAFSNDRGRTWTKYRNNPVVDLKLKDFRDPKVFWYKPQSKWVMVVSLADQHKLRFFASHDLLHWNASGDFGPAGAHGGAWECPDLFELPVPGENATRWVLVVNVNPGGVAGGSGTQYFVGSFDGTKFIDENAPSRQLWMDYGKDYYAAVSFFGGKPGDNRRIMLGWFSNWQYANDTPENGWRGAMNLPREINLMHTPEGIRVRQLPIRELKSLHANFASARVVPVTANQSMSLAEASQLLEQATADEKLLEMQIEFEAGAAAQGDSEGQYGLLLDTGGKQFTQVGIDRKKSSVYIDRTHSGVTNFSKYFPGRHDAALKIRNSVMLDVFLDRSSVEVFANDGEVTLADRIYPSQLATRTSLFYKGGAAPRVKSLKFWRMKSVWSDAPDQGAQIVPVRN
jgi:fructan beta-fructosidase